MQHFDDWDQIQEKEIGDFQRIPADGYVMHILRADIIQSRSGNEMLVLALDVAEGAFKDYFKAKFDSKRKRQPDTKWPCVFRQLTRGNSVGFFKNLIANIERSNSGYSFSASNFEEATLKGKLVGFLFRDEQWDYNGKKDFTAKPYSPKSVADIRSKNFEVPKPKLLDDEKSSKSSSNNNIAHKYDDLDVPF